MYRFSQAIGILFFLSIVSNPISGQQISVKGEFLQDTIVIGQDVTYCMSATYPRSYMMIFPDSSFDFSPFEYYGKKYFKTKSDSVFSKDSVIYHLATFELDTIQTISLPAYLVQGKDSTPLYTQTDSIFLKHVITTLPDSVALMTNTTFFKIPATFNYPLITLLLGFLAVSITLTIVFFGKRIFRWVQIMRIKKRHKKFAERFYQWLSELRDSRNTLSVEQILNEWKKYLERLEKQPYTKMTTKEIVRRKSHDEIQNSLKTIDRFIYGNLKESPLHKEFERLLDFSVDRYRAKLNEYGHAE